MTHDAGTRWIALVGATSLHVAVGLALLSAWSIGVPVYGRTDNVSNRSIAVTLVPMERPRTFESKASAAGSNFGSKDVDRPVHEVSPVGLVPAPATRVTASSDARAGPAQPPIAASGATADLPSAEVLAYRARLQAHLARYRVYPAAAQAQEQQGIVILHLLMDHDGGVIDIWVEASSGVAAIDREALAAAVRAQPLPAFPIGWPERLSLTVPINFRLS